MGLFLDPALAGRYNGAFSLRFRVMGTANPQGFQANFFYIIDDQGFRIEYIPPEAIEEFTVTRRAAGPTIIYFTRNASPADAGSSADAGSFADADF
jgi:hypothetical protein